MFLYEWNTFDEVCETTIIKIVANSLEEAQLMALERTERFNLELPENFLEDIPNRTEVSKPRIIYMTDIMGKEYYE